MSEASPFARLARLLRHCGLELDAEGIADALWLAQFQGPLPPQVERTVGGSSDDEALHQSPQGPAHAKQPPRIPSGGDRKEPDDRDVDSWHDGRLFAALGNVDAGGRRASPILVPDAKALPGSLDIGRAFRPFRRRRPAPHRRVLDEEGTAEATALFGFVRPVLLPQQERWFDIALVVDASRSMDAWQDTIKEFEQVLARQGAFAQVSRWRLVASGGIAIESAGRHKRLPSALHDPRRRTLILIVTNGVAAFWDGDPMARVLADWSARAPVAILQLFSESRWPHTAIGSPTEWVRATVPGAPGGKLAVLRKPWEHAPDGVELLAVPVLSLSPEAVVRWAQSVMAVGQRLAPAVVFAPGLDSSSEVSETGFGQPTDPRARVEWFHGIASREAYRLACHLAAVPLTLPIMRIVHQQICHQPRIEDLGEVLASGLLERVTIDNAQVDPDAVLYDLVEGVREVLLGSLPMESVFDIRARVQSALKEFIEGQLGRTIGNFRAFVLDERGEHNLPPTVEAFVEIERKLLQRLRPQNQATEPPETDKAPGPAAARDWAVVVGINRYSGFPSLNFAESDAQLVAEWLRSPAGGQLPPAHLLLLVSPWTASEIHAALLRVLESAQQQPAAATPPWRRLYLCFFGRGVMALDGSLAVPTANRSPQLEYIDGTSCLDFFARSGCFEEVALVMDCGLERLQSSSPRPLPFTPRPTGTPSVAKSLAIYGPGVERHEPGAERFVPALLDGLSGAAAGANGEVSVYSLRRHLLEQLPPEDQSLVVRTEHAETDWVLNRVEPRQVEAIFHLSPILAGTDVLVDGVVTRSASPSAEVWSLQLAPGQHVFELPAAGLQEVFEIPPSGHFSATFSWALRDRRVLIAGTASDHLTDPERWMSEALGHALALAGFSLVTGGWQGTDNVVTAAYAQRASLENVPPDRWLTQVVSAGRQPQFEGGQIVTTEQEFQFPPTLVEAAVLIGGKGGTRAFFDFTRQVGKPAFPLPGTGGVAKLAFDQLLSEGAPHAEALRRLDVALDSPDAARRIARALVRMLLAGDAFQPPRRWATSIVVTPGAIPVLQRDLPSGWHQLVVIPVDAYGLVRLNDELRSRLALPLTVSAPGSGFSLATATLSSQEVTRAFLVTLSEPDSVRDTIASNLRGLLRECSGRPRVRIWLPLLGREGHGLGRSEALALILDAIEQAGVGDRADMHFAIAASNTIAVAELVELRTIVQRAAGRPVHDVRAALSEAGISEPDDAMVAVFQRSAQLMFLQRPSRNNGRIKTDLLLLALLEGRREEAALSAHALRAAWETLAPGSLGRALATELPLLHAAAPGWPGPIVFSRDCAEVLKTAVNRTNGGSVGLSQLAGALLEQAASRDAGGDGNTARRVLDRSGIDPIALGDAFNALQLQSLEPDMSSAISKTLAATKVGDLRGVAGGDDNDVVIDIKTTSRVGQLAENICQILDGDQLLGMGFLIRSDLVLTTAEVARAAGTRKVQCATGMARPDPERAYVSGSVILDQATLGLVKLERSVPIESFSLSESDMADGVAVGARLWVLSATRTGGLLQIVAVASGRPANETSFYYRNDPTVMGLSASPGSPIFDETSRLVGLHRRYTTSFSEVQEGVTLKGLGNAVSSLSSEPMQPIRERGQSVAKQYAEEVYKGLGYLPAWPPGTHLQLGDVGILSDKLFTRVTSLKELGIGFTAEKSATASLSFSSNGVTQDRRLQLGKWRFSISFSRSNTVFFEASDCMVLQISDLRSLAETIIARYSRGEWDARSVIVSELVTAGALTLAIADRAPAQVDLLVEAGESAVPPSTTTVGTVVERSSSVAFQYVGGTGVTPLFRVLRVRKPIFGRARLVAGP